MTTSATLSKVACRKAAEVIFERTVFYKAVKILGHCIAEVRKQLKQRRIKNGMRYVEMGNVLSSAAFWNALKNG